jgi:hypothetical protein
MRAPGASTEGTALNDGTTGSHAITCTELARAVRDELDGFTVQVDRDGYRFILRYVPQAMVDCRTVEGSATVKGPDGTGGLDSGMDQYVLRIEHTAMADTSAMDIEAFLTWGLEKRVSARVGGIEVPCAFAHVESGPSNAPATNVLLGFDHVQDKSERVVTLRISPDTAGDGVEFRFPQNLFEQYERILNRDRS